MKKSKAIKQKIELITSFPGFKEGEIVTCEGLKPMLVTIAKNGKIVLIPKDE